MFWLLKASMCPLNRSNYRGLNLVGFKNLRGFFMLGTIFFQAKAMWITIFLMWITYNKVFKIC
jgi:hypothetical protein